MHRSFTHTLIAGAALLMAGHAQAGMLFNPHETLGPCSFNPHCSAIVTPGTPGYPGTTATPPTTTQPSPTNPPAQQQPAQEEKPPAEEAPAPAEEPSCKVIQALNGVSFKARECVISKSDRTAYEINYLLPSSPVDTFFISTQATGGQQKVHGSSLTLSANYISAAAWNDGKGSLLGQFSALFGTEDTGVFAFELDNSKELESGSWMHLGWSGAAPKSEILAVDDSGRILARSFGATANPVPEPGSWALAGLALAGVAGLRRRQGVQSAG